MKLRHVLLIVLLVVAGGCSNHVGLRGKVTFSDTGEPVPTGEIHFSTPTFLSRAEIMPNGTYVVGTYKETDGLPPGNYDVMIVVPDPEANQKTELNAKGMPVSQSPGSLIDTKYGRRETSGLKAIVDKSTKTLDFKVDRAKK